MPRAFFRRLLSGILLVLAFLIGFYATPSWAQVTQGSISVSVLDPSGAVIPKAKLTLQDLATNSARLGTTSSAGTYTFPDLPTGTYRLTVSKGGFESQVFNSVGVSATQVTDIKATLRVGAVTQKVEVTAQAVPIVQTTSNAIGSIISMKEVQDLPLAGRDISSLARLVPGFAGGTWNGLPFAATGNNIDGVVATTQRMKFNGAATPLVQPRVENIAEMTVSTDQLNLNSGYGLSDMQVNYVTKRGSNKFHGGAYENFSNSALDANTWANNATGIKRQLFIRNEFGASLGGPVLKNRLFFFGTFAMAKQPGSAANTNSVLTSAAQAGQFTFTDSAGTHTVNVLSGIAGSPAGAAVGATTPCCALPTTVNSNVQGILSNINSGVGSGVVKTPDSDPNLVDLRWTYPRAVTQYFPTARMDFDVSSKVRLFSSWNMTTLTEQNYDIPPLPGSYYTQYGGSEHVRNFAGSLGVDWTLSPTMINSFRAGYLYNRYAYGYDLLPVWDSQPAINFAYGASGVELGNLPVTTYYPIFNASDNVTWQKGSHTISFGFSYFREQDHYYNPPAGFPSSTLGIDPTDPASTVFTDYFNSHFPKASSTDLSNAENLYATLVGRISGVSGSFALNPTTKQYLTKPGFYALDELQHTWGLFYQDSWRVRPTLTINYGLRWDFIRPSQDLTGGYHSADNVGIWGPSGVGNIFNPGALTTNPGGLNPVYVARHATYQSFDVTPQPAIGLAWNPNKTAGLFGKLLGGNSTVIRAGFSLRRFTEPYQFFWNQASNEGYAFYQSFTLAPQVPGSTLPATGGYYGGSYALGGSQPAPYFVSPPTYQTTIPESDETFYGYWSGVNGMNENIRQPYTMSWNLGIQRELGRNNVLEVRYIGNRSVHQWVVLNPNEVNIFENKFINDFKQAQTNLAINKANGMGGTFANNSLPGQGALPIMTAAAGGNASFFTNGAFITDLNNGAAGNFASTLAGSPTYLCNLVGGANFSPCAGVTGAGYPINFFQANPYAAGKAIGYETDAGFGNYNALQVDLRQENWHGAQFDVNWTWSHSLGVQPNNSWTGALNLFTMRDLRESYAPTGFDYRHVVHVSGTYALPFGKGKALVNRGGVADRVVGGWTLGTIMTYQTGAPYELLAGGAYNTADGPTFTPVGDHYGDGGVVLKNGTTPSSLESSIIHVPGKPYGLAINPNCLTSMTNGLPNGNCLGPNTTAGVFGYHPWLYGPHAFTQDLALSKVVPIRENLTFQLQAEFTNLWNHPVWGNPAGGYNSTSQGFIQNTFATIESTSFGHVNVVQAAPGVSGIGARQIELRANIQF